MGSNQWAANVIKGRIAESIVEEMLTEGGYKVFRFGYESVLQHLAGVKLSKQDFYAKLIRDLPDFIILDESAERDNPHLVGTGKGWVMPSIYPIEVKFRKDGKIPKEYFIEIEDAEDLLMESETNEEFNRILNNTSTWRECIVIIVMPEEPYFKLYYPGTWMKKQLPIPEEAIPFGDIRGYPFQSFDKEMINKYKEFVKKHLVQDK